jgi:hypothetical protein
MSAAIRFVEMNAKLALRTIRVPMFPLPRLEAMESPVHRQLERSVASLQKARAIRSGAKLAGNEASPRPTRDAVDQRWLKLWHPYSERAVMASSVRGYAWGRSIQEHETLEATMPSFFSLSSGSEATTLMDWIAATSRLLGTSRPGIRTSDVFSARNDAGYRSLFPPQTMIAERIEQIHRFVCLNKDRHPVFTAVVAMVALTSCHPLYDGNGRMGRILFNAIFRECRVTSLDYIPLYDFFWISGLGYEIRVMSARNDDDWVPLFEYFGDLFDVGLVDEATSS